MDNVANEIKNCPFCAEEVKAAAIKCKHCGEMLNQDVSPAEKEKPENATTVEQTSKEIKWQQVIGTLVIFVGICVIFIDINWAIFVIIVGLVIYLTARIRGWWHHG